MLTYPDLTAILNNNRKTVDHHTGGKRIKGQFFAKQLDDRVILVLWTEHAHRVAAVSIDGRTRMMLSNYDLSASSLRSVRSFLDDEIIPETFYLEVSKGRTYWCSAGHYPPTWMVQYTVNDTINTDTGTLHADNFPVTGITPILSSGSTP